MMSGILLEAQKVGKRAGERWLLTNVSFTLKPGQTLAVMGPNGAGKSTLLRVLTGLTRLDEGSIFWRGTECVRSGSAAPMVQMRSEIGFLGHEPGLFPALSGRDNLRFFAGVAGASKPHEKAETALHEVGLDVWGDDPVNHYSRGMQQRLGLARALLQRPSLLFLDEPFTGLDPESGKWLERRLKDFRATGGSTLLVTHRFEEVAALADDYLILSHGHVASSGSLSGLDAVQLQDMYDRCLADFQRRRQASKRENP